METAQFIQPETADDPLVDLDPGELQEIAQAFDRLDRLVGLQPVKERVREIASLLLVDRLRNTYGLTAERPTLHMSFTGRPGTGKTTVALEMAGILHRLGYIRKNHMVVATRNELVGQFVGHTAPKTKEMVKKALGGVLFVDEAYYLYRVDNERDYGQETIEMLLQEMESHREDLVVIFAGYADRMDVFYRSNPGLYSRIGHHIAFPDYSVDELLAIADRMLADQSYAFAPEAREAFGRLLAREITSPHFSNARTVRNQIDQIKLRHADRLYREVGGPLRLSDLRLVRLPDIPEVEG